MSSSGLEYEVDRRTHLEGVLVGHGRPANKDENLVSGLVWQLNPDEEVTSIELVREHFEWGEGVYDAMFIYTSLSFDQGLHTTYSKTQPMPEQVEISGSDALTVLLNSQKPDTSFRIRYKINVASHKLGPFEMGEVGYFWTLLAMLLVFLLLFWWFMYLMCFCVSSYSHRRAMRQSQMGWHSDLEDLARAVYLQEQHTALALRVLPTHRWRDTLPQQEAWKVDECCLCLEAFMDDEEIRVLPCLHYFHRACVDKWFESRRFKPWTCPQCRQNPFLVLGAMANAKLGSDEVSKRRAQAFEERFSMASTSAASSPGASSSSSLSPSPSPSPGTSPSSGAGSSVSPAAADPIAGADAGGSTAAGDAALAEGEQAEDGALPVQGRPVVLRLRDVSSSSSSSCSALSSRSASQRLRGQSASGAGIRITARGRGGSRGTPGVSIRVTDVSDASPAAAYRRRQPGSFGVRGSRTPSPPASDGPARGGGAPRGVSPRVYGRAAQPGPVARVAGHGRASPRRRLDATAAQETVLPGTPMEDIRARGLRRASTVGLLSDPADITSPALS